MGSWSISSAHGVWGRIWLEVRKQCVIAGPMVCTNLLQYSITIVSIIYVGHLGELELSSASIATSFASVTGYTLLVKLLLVPPQPPHFVIQTPKPTTVAGWLMNLSPILLFPEGSIIFLKGGGFWEIPMLDCLLELCQILLWC